MRHTGAERAWFGAAARRAQKNGAVTRARAAPEAVAAACSVFARAASFPRLARALRRALPRAGCHPREGLLRAAPAMDVHVGLVGDGFVMLVSDTSRVQSIVVQRTSLDKIVQLDSHKLMVRPCPATLPPRPRPPGAFGCPGARLWC